MIVVKVELWPGGDWLRAKQIASMEIANISNLAAESAYIAKVRHVGDSRLGIPALDTSVDIPSHHRKEGIWPLIRKVLERVKT